MFLLEQEQSGGQEGQDDRAVGYEAGRGSVLNYSYHIEPFTHCSPTVGTLVGHNPKTAAWMYRGVSAPVFCSHCW